MMMIRWWGRGRGFDGDHDHDGNNDHVNYMIVVKCDDGYNNDDGRDNGDDLMMDVVMTMMI